MKPSARSATNISPVRILAATTLDDLRSSCFAFSDHLCGSLLELSDRTPASRVYKRRDCCREQTVARCSQLHYELDRARDLVKTAHNVGGAKFRFGESEESSVFVCRREMRFAKFVILVVDVQHRLASEPHRGCSLIVGRHPEITGFEVCLEYPALLCPK